MNRRSICFFSILGLLVLLAGQPCFSQDADIYEDPSWKDDASSNVKVFPQTSGVINNAVYNPDNRYVLTGHADGSIKIWETETGILLRTYYDHTKTVIRVAWSKDGKFIASGDTEGAVKIRNADLSDTGVLHNLKHGNFVFSVLFSPDSRYLLSASDDRTIRVWDVSNGRMIRTLAGHTAAVTAIDYSSDGRIASASDDKNIIIWNADTGLVLKTLTGGHTQRAMSVAWSPDNRQIVSTTVNANIRIWNVDTGENRLIGRAGLSGVVYGAKFSPDGKQIVSVGGFNYVFERKRGIAIWDAQTGNEIRRFSSHSGIPSSIEWSLDGKRILTGSPDTSALIHDIQTGQCLTIFTGKVDPIWAAVLSNDGKRLVTGSGGKKVNVWNAQTGVIERSFEHIGHIYSAAISPDGRLAAAGAEGGNNQLKVWDVDNGTELHSFNLPVIPSQGNIAVVNTLVFHPQGRFLVSGTNEKTIRIFDVISGTEVNTLSGHMTGIISLAFSRDGRILASSAQADIRIWESTGGSGYRLLRTFQYGSFNASHALSPDGKFVATGFMDGRVLILDVNTGKEQYWNVGALARSFAFSPDGNSLIVGVESSNTIHLWEANKKGVMEYKGIRKTLNGSITSLRYSSGGKRIIAGIADGAARIYNAKTFREIAAFAFFTGEDNQIIAGARGLTVQASKTVSQVDGEWLCITPDGFYRGSTRGDRYINVLIDGNDLSSMDAYSDHFHKPNIVESRLRGLPDPEKPQFTIQQAAQFRPPVIKILSPETGTTVTSSNGSVNIAVNVTDRSRPIEDIRILVNGVRLGDKELNAVTGTNGITAVTGGLSVRGNLRTVQFSVPVNLIERGNNRIEVMAYNGVSWGYSGYVGSVNINWQPPQNVNIPLPDLWVLAVGVNKYDNAMTDRLPNLGNLNYCGNDAREIVRAFKTQEGKRFKTVNTRLITDGEIEPTAENVRNGIKFLEGAGQRDVVLLFMAGHGINEDGKFYFLTKDASLQNNKVNQNFAVSDDALKAALNMPGRRLIFIDACQSGGMDMNQFMYSLRRTNAYMLSSSEGDKPSYENSQYRHGLFTYSVIRGLSGMAKPSSNSDISVLQLSGYVRDAVMKLTEGRSFQYQQKPVQYSWGFSDFFIAR